VSCAPRAVGAWMRSNGGRTLAALSQMGARVSCQTENGAVTSAVLAHLRVESADFDWRWRALAGLAWEAMARDPLERLRRIQQARPGNGDGRSVVVRYFGRSFVWQAE
jgi:hypothetical protein